MTDTIKYRISIVENFNDNNTKNYTGFVSYFDASADKWEHIQVKDYSNTNSLFVYLHLIYTLKKFKKCYKYIETLCKL